MIPTRERKIAPRKTKDRLPTSGCPDVARDPKSLLAALRPLGDSSSILEHASNCQACFGKIKELFLTTSPDEHDPIHRLFDGLNSALYRLAKSILVAANDGVPDFAFDREPGPIDTVVREAGERLDVLAEYSEGSTLRSAAAVAVKTLVDEAAHVGAPDARVAEQLLKRSVSLGGRFGLDAANLLGFLRARTGDYDGAELLFRAVIERTARDSYESETQAHAMNNLTTVHIGRGNLRLAILWCERSLMLKERLGLDARTNYLNLMFFWIEHGTSYGTDRARHYLRVLLGLEGGKAYLTKSILQPQYAEGVKHLRTAGFDREFPELAVARR
jgi:hypothetical protein